MDVIRANIIHISGKKHFDFLVAFLVYLVIALIIMGNILLSPGTIGFFHDWFIGPYDEMNKFWANNGLYKWDSQLGNKVYDSDWIIRLTLLPFPFLGGEVLSKGLLILSLTVSGFGAFCLGRRLKLSWYVSFAAGLLYMFSPIIFTRIVAGYIYYLIAYFLSPLILESFLRGKDENNYRYFVISGLLLSFAIIQIQFLPMVILVLLIFSLVDFKTIKRSMIGLVIVVSISVLVTLNPLLISQLVTKNVEVPFNPTQLLSYFTVVTASDLTKSFRMLGYEGMPYSYLNIGTSKDVIASNPSIPQWVFYLDFLLPITGFAVLLFRRDTYTVSFAVLSIIGLYFLKGINPPFPEIFSYLFLRGLYVFREVWHFAFLYSISITFLIAFFLERLKQTSLRIGIKISICVVLTSLIAISNGYPLFLGNFAGYLQTYEFPDEYHDLYKELLTDPHYNVLVLPYVNPIRYDNLRLQGVDPIITDSPSMIFPTILGNRASPTISVSTWLLSVIQQNGTHNLGKLLTGFGIKYVILRNDFVSNYPSFTPLGSLPNFRISWYSPLEPILDQQDDLKLILNNQQYRVYENLNIAEKIFPVSMSAGGLTDFNSLLLISNVTPLGNVGLYTMTSNKDILTFVDAEEEKTMSVDNFIELGNFATTADAQNGWANNRDSFGYDYVLASRVNDGLFSAKAGSEVSFDLPSKYDLKEAEIWMKVLSWNQGGLINVAVDENKYPVSLFSYDRGFRLVKIFDGISDNSLHIKFQNMNGRNYIEGLYIKEKNEQLRNGTNKIFVSDLVEQKGHNLVPNSLFTTLDNKSGIPTYWKDPGGSCANSFECISSTDGWGDKYSFQISTKFPNNEENKWSLIYGPEIQVATAEKYEVLTHMKLNAWASQSHVLLEGYNEPTQRWYQITQCPRGKDGPAEWSLERCEILIPENTTKIRPVLNAGWSSDARETATSWFDAIYIGKMQPVSQPNIESKNLSFYRIGENISSIKIMQQTIKEFNKINPTHWTVSIQTTEPTAIAFAEPYDQNWEATIYDDDKKVDVVKSVPLYGTINSFNLNYTGNLFIDLRFAPQYWYEAGLVVSGIIFALSVSYIVYPWIKDRIKLRLHN